MRIFLAILGGVVATLGLYASGFLTAMFFLSAEPTPVWKPNRDTASVWTPEPVVVSNNEAEFERQPPRQVADGPLTARAETVAGEADIGSGPVQQIDNTTAASIDDQSSADFTPERVSAINTAHVQWCADRYRSYRIEDNSYNPYRGGRRECISPYSNDAFASAGDEEEHTESAVSAEVTGRLSPRHIQSCFNRYQSYRPSDNSYQPYGGGPRRQCR